MLSDLKIRKGKQKDKPYKVSDGFGLFLLVKPNGSKLWQHKYRFLGKERLISYGRYPEVSLVQARGKRDATRQTLLDGKDPAVVKRIEQVERETKARNTFGLIAAEYLEHQIERNLAQSTMDKKRWCLTDLI